MRDIPKPKKSTTGVAGVCCERRSAQDVKGTFQEGPNAGGGGLVPTRIGLRVRLGLG